MILCSFEYFTSSLCSSLISCLSLPVSPDTSNNRNVSAAKQIIEFIPSSSSPLNGIIARLMTRGAENVHDRSIVSITANGNNGIGSADKSVC
jgi:hypothetical protein